MTSNSKNFSASYINARWVGHDSINVIEISNPADFHQVIGRVAFADSTLAKKAVEAAHTAWPQWRNTSVQTRFELIDVLLNVIQKHREQIARIITLENGKTLTESLNEVDASLNEARFQL
ncbi:MAG: aldehyde dehydrogenase family protein, partial [Calditrichaeota bacterium]